jgi:uncharacterized C2H2 Zn-finger protein
MDKQRPEPALQESRRCPACGAMARLKAEMLEPRTGKIVELYRCPCGKHIWSNEDA